MIVAAIDLEMNKPSNKIIQIGLHIGDLLTGEAKISCSWNINPNEPIDPFITQLTGIRDIDVVAGFTLEQAYKDMCGHLAQYKPFMNPLTWGGGDAELLRNQLGLTDERFVFGRRWIDVKTLYQSWRFSQNESIRSGLAKSMTRVGLKFEGTKHTAMDDASNTFRIYRELLKRFQGAKIE